VHRVGRTARAGQQGCAITFLSEKDRALLKGMVEPPYPNSVNLQVISAPTKELLDIFPVCIPLPNPVHNRHLTALLLFLAGQERWSKAEKQDCGQSGH
jgi:superfamily II DNA/RNA helicase